VDETEPSGTADPKTSAGSSSSLRGRLGDGWIIAAMAVASIVSIGAILGWALFTGNNKSDNVGSSGSSAAPINKTLDVTLGEFFVKPASINLPKGSTLTLNVKNVGAVPHDLKVGSQVTPMLNPGKSSVLKVGVVVATVQGFCTVPGHKAAGMTFDVVVDSGGTSASAGHDMTGSATAGGIDPNDAKIDPAATPAKGFKAADPNIPAMPNGTVHNVTFEAVDKVIEVAPGVKQNIWTFNGTVPGPTLRGHVGDTFNVKLVNKGSMGHSLDFHASQTSMDVDMRTIEPGQSLTYSFVAQHSGMWMYHCGTPPVLHHIANGMYGAVIIDPPNLPRVDHEYVMVQSEFYLGQPGKEADLNKAMAGTPDAVVFNGYYNQYVYDPIKVKVGDRIRVWVLDVGPNEISAFHIVGTQFDTVFKEGAYLLRPDNPEKGGAQVLGLMPAEGGFVELNIPKKGMYAIVTHKFNDASRGGAGHIIAE
jgi:nitrite reductase (NO-forming)